MKRILLGIALVAVLLLSATSSGLAYQGSGGDLFEEAGRTVGILGVSQQTVIRSRNVNVHFNLLPDAADVAGDQAAGSDLILNLFADVSYTAVFDEMTSISPTSYSWAGHLEGVKLSNVNLVVDDGNMVGNIVFPGGMYSIRYQANGTHTIYELDPAAFPPEEPSQSGRRDGSPGMAAVDDDAYQSLAVGNVEDGSVIDVLVVYTGDAETAAGGSAAINTLINLAIAETNTGYAQSDIFTRMRLVHTQKVTYSEAAFNWFTTVNRLRNNGDGYMDNVHTLRNKYRADVVMLLVANGAYCGLAYDIMNPVSHAFNANAFAITNYSCATGYYSFGHEAGHLQSARHDWYVDDTLNSPYSFNHALVHPSVTPANHWRTVMGYANDCIDSGFGNCTRLLYWSNPFNVYSGDVMGFEQGTNTSCTYLNLANPDCDADNHRTLNQTAVTMANFRIAELEPLAPKGTIKDRTPTYKWTKKKNATQYQLQVTQNYVQIINVKMGSGVCIGVRCSFTPAKVLKYNTKNFWRVRALVGGKWRAWSDWTYFTVSKCAGNFRSRFTYNAKCWNQVNGTWNVVSGKYTTLGVATEIASASHETYYKDFVFSARMKRTGCPGCANRIYLRGQPYPLGSASNWYSGYMFQYSNDGYFAVYRLVDGNYKTLKDWTTSTAINPGGWNVLKVIGSGYNFKFYINGTLVWIGSDAGLTNGQVGLAMYHDASLDNKLLVDWARMSNSTFGPFDLADEPVEGGQEIPGGTVNQSP